MIERSDSDPAVQAERANLREIYLRTIADMADKTVTIKMFENVTIEAIFKACDPDGQKLFVTDADIPVGGTLPSAILRCSDVISVHFQSD